MKSFLFSLMLFFCFFAKTEAQAVLLFPETTAATSSELPTNLCVQHSTRIIAEIQPTDTSQMMELSAFGRKLMRLGKHEYAKDAFDKVVEMTILHYGKKDIHYMRAMLDLARSYVLLIRYDEATGLYDEITTWIKETLGENSWMYALALSESLEVNVRVRNAPKVAKSCNTILAILENLGKKGSLEYAITLHNLAVSQNLLGESANAISTFQNALNIVAQIPKAPADFEVSLAASLAEAYAMNNQREISFELLEKYIPIADKLLSGKDISHVRVWIQYGSAYSRLKEYDKAIECFKKTLVCNSLVYNKIESIPLQADDLMFKNEYLATCGQAATMMYLSVMYKEKYRITKDPKDLQDGYLVVQAMVKFGEKLQNSYTSEQNKLILFQVGASLTYETATYLAYHLYKTTNNLKYVEEAFSYSEKGKSTLLLNSLLSKKDAAYGNLPDSLAQKEQAYLKQTRVLQKRFLEKSADKAQQALVQQDINDLTRKIEQLKNQIQQVAPAYYTHHYNKEVATLADIQKMLPAQTALIEYALGQDDYFAFLFTNTTATMVELKGTAEDLEIYSSDLRKTLSNYTFINSEPQEADALFQKSSSYFYQTYLEPLLSQTKDIEHLMIVPDKSLGHLPFEIFLTGKPDKVGDYANYPYLLKKYSVGYAYSMTLHLEKRKQHNQPKNQGIFAFAADYGNKGENENLLAELTSKRGSDAMTLRRNLDPLPGAKKEVELLSECLSGEFLLGQAANEERFKKEAGDYSIIHLAMHGLLNSKEPILSSLAFTENGTAQEDNFLHTYEISQMDLTADLVVLSACETGYGKFRQGEGVMSLAHSFMYAGAASVLVSLWQVNDYSTGVIMKYFYTNLAHGMTKSEALRQAKLTYLSETKGSSAHPAYWAAFVQMGDNVPLELVHKSGFTFREIGITMGAVALALLVIIVLFIRKKVKKSKLS